MRPGHHASYTIWVWSPAGASQVSVDALLAGPRSVGPARFTVCPAPDGHLCNIATLPPGQAFELVLSVKIGRHTHAGKFVTVNVVAQAPEVSPAQVTLAAAVAPGAPGARPHRTAQPSATPSSPPTTPPVGNPSLPVPGSTVTPGSLPGLFPTVTPSPQSTPGTRAHGHHRVHVTLTSATLPITLRLVGGQLAGLAVLAAAITMVIARLSLRRPKLAGRRPAGETGSTSPAHAKKKR